MMYEIVHSLYDLENKQQRSENDSKIFNDTDFSTHVLQWWFFSIFDVISG